MRLRLDLAYDGTDFHGWARQPALRSVQGELEAAFDTVLRVTGTRLTVAGRTDAGVHARGQVAHVDVDDGLLAALPGRDQAPPLVSLLRRLNGVTAPDVRVHRVVEAPAGFDARFGAVWRRYAYRIADDPATVDPIQRHAVVAWPRPLDEDAMNAAAAGLVGLQDFAAFCRKREGATTIRTLLELRWERVAGVLVAGVKADAFCHSMVRSLVGCLAAIGEGRKEPAWAAEMLAGRIRDASISVAPAHGLTLEEVGYPADEDLEAQVERSAARRTLPDG